MDALLCIFFLKKRSEGVLMLIIVTLIFALGKLLELNPISELNDSVYTYVAAGATAITFCIMMYHLFFKVIPASPYNHGKRKHAKTPAKRERED